MGGLRQRLKHALGQDAPGRPASPVGSGRGGDEIAAENPASPRAGAPLSQAGEKQRYLSEIEIFCDLSQNEIDDLARSTRMVTTEKGRVFYFPEEAGEVVFLLKRGKVQLYRLSSEGRKLVIATLPAGAVFGEMSLIGQGMYNTYAEAVEDCLICVMSRQEMAQLLVQKPQISLRILEVLGRRLQQAETQLEDVAFKKVPERLALLLLRLIGIDTQVPDEEAGESRGTPANAPGARAAEEQGPREITGLTHQDLAEMIATHRETVSFTLSDFKARGLIELAPKRITILDIEGLLALCS